MMISMINICYLPVNKIQIYLDPHNTRTRLLHTRATLLKKKYRPTPRHVLFAPLDKYSSPSHTRGPFWGNPFLFFIFIHIRVFLCGVLGLHVP